MANEQIGLETVIKNDDFQKGLQTYTQGLQTMNRATDQAAQSITTTTAKMGTNWRQYGETIDRTGRQSMIGIRAVSEALSAIGIPTGIVDATRGAANMADTFGDLGGIVADINPTFLALGAAASVVAIGLYAITEASKENAKYIADAVKPAQDLYEAIHKINQERAFAQSLGTDPENLKKLAQSSEEAGTQIEKMAKAYLDFQTAKAKTDLLQTLKTSAIEDKNVISIFRAGEFIWEDYARSVMSGQKVVSNTSPWIAAIQYIQQLNNNVETLGNTFDAAAGKVKSMGQFGGNQSGDLLKIAGDAQAKYIDVYNSSAERIAGIESDLADRRIEINQATAQRIADINENLSHTLANLQRDYGKQLEQFAKQEVQIKNDAAKQIAQIERDTQKQLAQIDKDAAEQIADVNKNEAKSLADVDANLRKTLRNIHKGKERREAIQDAADRKKEIIEQAAERRADIERQAAERKQQLLETRNERLADIETQRQERLQALAEQKQAALEEHNYRVQEARDAAAQQIELARRTAAEQIAAAQKAADKQTEAITKALNEQHDIMLQQMRGLQVSMGVAGSAIGTALGQGFVNGLAPLVNAEVARVMALINTILTMIRNIQNFSPASLGTASQAPAMGSAVMQPVSNTNSVSNRVYNVSVPISGTFNGTTQAGVEAIANRVAHQVVTNLMGVA